MSLPELLEKSISWLAWAGVVLTLTTLISFLFSWGPRFRLIGITGFTFLLAASGWAFANSYTPPVVIEGAMRTPVVFDNGDNLVISQAPTDFPKEAVKPTLEQLAGNIRGGGRNGGVVHVRLRQVLPTEEGVSRHVILGEVERDLRQNTTTFTTDINNGAQ